MDGTRTSTTRRSFVAAVSFGTVSLYGLWAAFGAAPFFGLSAGPADHAGGAVPAADPDAGHGGHGAGDGMSPEAFRRLAEEFAARHRLADGSVAPGRTGVAPPEGGGEAGSHGGAHGHAAGATTGASGSVDVYLMAFRWGFAPSVLRLDTGVPYRFRMMAVDVSHGASMQLGWGSRIVRLRRGALVERVVTFVAPGEHLVYCTVYCGPPHDRMAGRIVVA